MNQYMTLFLAMLTTLSVTAQLPQISLVQLAGSYASPVDIKSCGDQRLFIVEQKGLIRILYKDGTKQTTPFLDIDARVNNSQDEQGLLGVAFSPNYKQDGYFYVQYTTGPGVDSIRISRFSVLANDSTQADPNSERVLISFKDLEWNHNGGNLMFGPDGYLYITEGDGGSGNDPDASHGTGGNGQNQNTFFGKMLRLDVSNPGVGYSVPPTNPFVGVPNTKPEIWAYGLRNPWRCSFDRVTGDLWIGDVGQNTYEEIDFQPAGSPGGQNYGWRCREGFHLCPTSNTSGCSSTGYTDPIHELTRTGNIVCSVTGGYVYRGTQYGRLFGRYLFTDYCAGQLWSITQTSPGVFDVDTLVVSPLLTYQLTSFGQDNLGELYLAYRGSSTGSTGRIYRITETSDCKPVAFISLNDTVQGCNPVSISALQGDTLSYQWYDSNGPVNGAGTYQFSPSQSGWYKVKVSKQQVGCEAMSDSVYVVLNEPTALSTANTIIKLCNTSEVYDLNTYVTPTGGSFSGSGVSGTNFDPVSATLGNNNITYTYTNNFGCVSSVGFNAEVGNATSLGRNLTDSLFCSSEIPLVIDSIILPAGGLYSGSGVSGNTFTPALAAIGSNVVTYSYTNTFGCVSTEVINFEVDDCTGLQDMKKEVAFDIFPNPSKGVFTVHVAVNTIQQAELIVTDGVGKMCYRKAVTLHPAKTELPVELSLAKGVYTIQLKGEKGNAVRSLVIE